MLKPLIKISIASVFSNIFHNQKKNSIGKKILYGILFGYLVIAVLFLSATAFLSVASAFVENGMSWLYFALAAVLVLILTVFGSFSIAQSLIYNSKDNDLLLSLPIKVSDILASRTLVLLLFNYLYSFFIFIPAGVVYTRFLSFSFGGIIAYIILSLLLPLFTTTISLVFAWLLTLVTSRLKNKNIFAFIFAIVFLLGYMYISFNLQNVINAVINNSQQISLFIKNYLSLFYCYGTAITNGNILSFIICALVCVLPFVLAIYILSKTFLKLVNGTKTNSVKVTTKATMNQSSAFKALFKKEFQRFISIPTYILNTTLGGILSVIIALMFLIRGEEVFQQIGLPFELQSLLPVLLATVLAFFAGMNSSTVASVSLEGSAIFIMKSLPVNPRDFYNAKLSVNLAYGLPLTLIATVIASIALKGAVLDTLIVVLFPIALQIFAAIFGLSLNMHKFKFDWTNPIYPVKQSTTVLIEILLAMLISVAPFIFYIAAFENIIDYQSYYLGVTALIFVINSAIYLHIMKSGKKYFEMMS